MYSGKSQRKNYHRSVLMVEKNQGTLCKGVDYFTGYLFERDGGQEDGVAFDEYEMTEKGHGRIGLIAQPDLVISTSSARI